MSSVPLNDVTLVLFLHRIANYRKVVDYLSTTGRSCPVAWGRYAVKGCFIFLCYHLGIFHLCLALVAINISFRLSCIDAY